MKARCAGLLEVLGVVATSPHSQLDRINGRVQFLHRIVRDYLKKPDIWNLLISHTAKIDFNPCICLLRSYILQLKTVPGMATMQELWKTATAAMEYASRPKLNSSNAHMALLEQLNRAMTVHVKSRRLIILVTEPAIRHLEQTNLPSGKTHFSH